MNDDDAELLAGCLWFGLLIFVAFVIALVLVLPLTSGDNAVIYQETSGKIVSSSQQQDGELYINLMSSDGKTWTFCTVDPILKSQVLELTAREAIIASASVRISPQAQPLLSQENSWGCEQPAFSSTIYRVLGVRPVQQANR